MVYKRCVLMFLLPIVIKTNGYNYRRKPREDQSAGYVIVDLRNEMGICWSRRISSFLLSLQATK
jgi:hypothetical protein